MCQRMFNVLNFPTYQNKIVGAIHVGNMGLGHDDGAWPFSPKIRKSDGDGLFNEVGNLMPYWE